MELLLTLGKKEYLETLNLTYIDGFIYGSILSYRFNYSINDLISIKAKCDALGVKSYLSIDAFVKEEDKAILINYFETIKNLEFDGIYFHDLAVYDVAKSYEMEDKLIYDGKTMTTNSLDIAFYLGQGIDGVVVSKELTLDEVMPIIDNMSYKLDMQIFGHTELSNSKRMFLTNYFKQIGDDRNIKGKETLAIIEEQRNYSLPIVEDEYGTHIYSDYCLCLYEELPLIAPLLKRGIVDDRFINENVIVEVIRDIRRITRDNCKFLKYNLINSHPEIDFSTGYLYEETNITKDE